MCVDGQGRETQPLPGGPAQSLGRPTGGGECLRSQEGTAEFGWEGRDRLARGAALAL